MIRATLLTKLLAGCKWHVSFEYSFFMGIEVAMENILDALHVDKFTPQLKTHNHGFTVVFTAYDQKNCRTIEAPILENGQIKIYDNGQQAFSDAMQKLNVLQGKSLK